MNVLVYRDLLTNNRCQVVKKNLLFFMHFFLANDDSDQTALSHPSRVSVICQNDRACHFEVVAELE